jgi:hypothetical protein
LMIPPIIINAKRSTDHDDDFYSKKHSCLSNGNPLSFGKVE